MKPKLLVTIIILVVCIIAWAAYNMWFGNSTLDINLHDTYFVILPFHWLLFYAKVVLVLVFGARCIVGRFRSAPDNGLLLIALFLMQQACISVEAVLNQLHLMNHGWTNYPPLSALPKSFPPQPHVLWYAGPILSIVQIILTILLVIVAIITGRNWYKTTNETIS